MKIHAHISGFNRRDDGAALVEFAILLPIMLLMFAFAVESGRLVWSYQATAAGVRDAARYVARVASTDNCPLSATPTRRASDYEPKAEEIVSRTAADNPVFDPLITVDDVLVTVKCESGDPDYRISSVPIAIVSAQITITFPFSGIFELNGGGLPAFTATITDQSRIFGV